MKNVFFKELIVLNYNAKNKDDVIEKMTNIFDQNNYLIDKEEFKKNIKEREKTDGTGLEDHIAIPHAKGKFVKKYGIVALRVNGEGFDFQSPDKKLSKLFFMIASPETITSNEHIKAISNLTNILSQDTLRNKLMATNSIDKFYKIITDFKDNNVVSDEAKNNKTVNYDILAVTACPTGIAHTYTASNALKKAAKELNINIKVETNGAAGVEDPLTTKEIKNAKGIIIAADRTVEIERFDSKPLINVGIKDGISKAKELIQNILNNKVPIYKSSSSFEETNKIAYKGKINIYKHLMNGISFMLPFVISGGVIIAISFMFGIKAFDIKDPSYNKIADVLMKIGSEGAFFLMIPILSGYIALSIAERPGLAPGMITGLIMNKGNAGFLGGILAGFLSGYITLFIKQIANKIVPKNFQSINPVLTYPFFSVLISGVITYFILTPIAFINEGILSLLNGFSNTNMALLGAILGGMMSVDMGGPVNKAAYAFGIAMITAGNYIPHASVMAGGMIPPIGLALATTIFKDKFNKEEQESGKICYVLGACFITEGVIPFAASDPFKIIPACIIGSAIGGFFSALSSVKLMAPHGGIFILPIVQNPLMWIASILIGSLIAAFLIGCFKSKPK